MIPIRESDLQTTGKRVIRKYRRAQLRKMQRRECSKLRGMVPAVADENDAPEALVIEEAVKYIDKLHEAVAERLQTVDEGNQIQDMQAAIFDIVRPLLMSQLNSPHDNNMTSHYHKKMNKAASYMRQSTKVKLRKM